MLKLYCEDCLPILKEIEYVDCIITDPPFGTHRTDWDNEPSEEVWKEFQRICPSGPIAIFGYPQQLFRWFKYFNLDLIGYIVWHKYNEIHISQGLTRAHQDIMILGKSIKQVHADKVREPYSQNKGLANWYGGKEGMNDPENNRIRGALKKKGEIIRNPEGRRCTDVWSIPAPGAGFNYKKRLHPNQKPDEVLRKLVLLLSNEGETILDSYMGSGVTGKQSLLAKRNFIGIEKEKKYFDIAKEQIEKYA